MELKIDETCKKSRCIDSFHFETYSSWGFLYRFVTSGGVFPFLFSLFINDLELYLQQNADAGLTLDQLSIYLLMFADDAVIFSNSVDGLQSSLNNLESYCLKWNLKVNVDKTKIVFRKGGI